MGSKSGIHDIGVKKIEQETVLNGFLHVRGTLHKIKIENFTKNRNIYKGVTKKREKKII
jgi:hypothetical protein